MNAPAVNNNADRAEKCHRRTPTRRQCAMTRWRDALKLLCGLLLLADTAAAQAAGRAFADDFEAGNLSKWSADGSRNMCRIVQRGIDGSTPHGGQNMMECNWNGTVAWDDPNAYTTVVLPQEAWPYNREFLIRFWVKYDQDVSHTYGGKVMRLFPPDKLDGFYIIAQMASAGGPAQVVWETFNGAAGPTFWGAGTPLGDHRWHKLEIYIKASSSNDGVARFWFDGALKSEVTNTATVASGHTWGPLYLMSNWSNNPGWEHGANNHIYWDDVEVFTDNANGATGSMSDGTISAGIPPNPPSGVVVH